MTFKDLRERSGLSLVKFSEYFGIAYRTVQHWEYGTRACPDYLINLMAYKLEKEGLISMTKYYVTICDRHGNEFHDLVTTDLDKAKEAADYHRYCTERDGGKETIEIRVYTEDIEDESCDCFDYNTVEF